MRIFFVCSVFFVHILLLSISNASAAPLERPTSNNAVLSNSVAAYKPNVRAKSTVLVRDIRDTRKKALGLDSWGRWINAQKPIWILPPRGPLAHRTPKSSIIPRRHVAKRRCTARSPARRCR
ncbi:MAG: hypothetical protein CMH54_05600 [Myxococcales bacterium]|nr:hypothetical protein [Myxococcales bacterium]